MLIFFNAKYLNVLANDDKNFMNNPGVKNKKTPERFSGVSF
jgi:hypothetical protein